MAKLAMALAIGLMLLQILTWIQVVRYHGPLVLNALYSLLAMLMLWCYVLTTAVKNQGQPPLQVLLDYEAVESGNEDKDREAGDKGAAAKRYCDVCDCTKPPNVHHCSVCERCIYRMDHHCPWTSNCVGFNNKKHFLLFLLYTILSCVVYAMLTSPLSMKPQNPQLRLSNTAVTVVRITLTLSCVVGLLLAGFFCFHLWLLATGKTTLEFLTNRDCEFQGQGFMHTASVYFGSNKLLWLVPVPPDCLISAHQQLAWTQDDDDESRLLMAK